MKTTKVGKVMNPTGGYRKQICKREIKHAEGALVKVRKHKKRQLEELLKWWRRRKKFEEKNNEQGEATTSVMFSMIWFRPLLPPMPPPSLSGSEGDSRFPESSIQTFDETKQVGKELRSSTGIDLAHATLEVVNGRISDDIDEWQYNNPTPATMMIISDEADDAFSDFLPHLLQSNKVALG
ncbi:hypothetical protein F2Q69_00025303 [Brassica cretica]|uniref:Uncharacterized protein n=1 Tax=Brassica cretica TaxID=69181 RepID=A0A8S9QK46_BRACR|nr:hypothetical protein F2Q69_00025303 [Brassica cretica]